MKDRIKELAEKASFKNKDEESIQYFAELIVRECANEILKWKSEPFPYDPEFGAKLIKDHFGIK